MHWLFRTIVQMGLPYAVRYGKTIVAAAHKVLQDKGAFNFEKTINSFQEQYNQTRYMDKSEALKVLQLDQNYTKEQVLQMLVDNDPDQGGSFYLQCKAYGAKKILIRALGEECPSSDDEK